MFPRRFSSRRNDDGEIGLAPPKIRIQQNMTKNQKLPRTPFEDVLDTASKQFFRWRY